MVGSWTGFVAICSGISGQIWANSHDRSPKSTFVSESRIFCFEIHPEIFGPMFRLHIAESKFQMKDLDSSDRIANLTTIGTFGG